MHKSSFTGSEIAAANAATPQSTAYAKSEVDMAIKNLSSRLD